jgi:glutaconate CoA-transferase subunit B
MQDPLVTTAERMVVAIAREIEDGDMVLEGIGTFLPTSAYMLAQATHAPNAIRLCPVGNTFVKATHPLSCFDYEFETLRLGLYHFDYQEVNTAYLPTFIPRSQGAWKEFQRPAQVDATGRTNNVVIGDHARPRVRLPGAAGLPDGVPIEPRVFMYVPRHNRQTFVERLDFTSAPGHEEGAHPFRIITDLGILGFDADGRMQVEGLFPGATRERIIEETGFPLRFRAELSDPPAPSAEELEILRTRIDPLSLRDLEFYGGLYRLNVLTDIACREPGYDRLRARIRQLASQAEAT